MKQVTALLSSILIAVAFSEWVLVPALMMAFWCLDIVVNES